ncbi:MAG: PAS domain S-box protein, partial [Myxococcota bacterium]
MTNEQSNPWFDAMPTPGFVVDNKGNISVWNQAIANFTGVTASGAIGRVPWRVFFTRRQPLPVDDALESGEAVSDVVKLVNDDGEAVEMTFTATPLEDNSVICTLEPSAGNGNDQLRSVLEQTIDSVVQIDENNTIVFFNPAAEKLWGYPASQVIGQNVKMLVPSELRLQHDGLVNANRQTGQNKIVGTSRDVQIERSDGKRPWVNLSLSKVLVDGNFHYTAFVRDITKQRQQQEQIRSVLEQAIDAVVQIDESNVVIYFNPAAEKLWGYAASDVIGKNVKMLVPSELRHQHDGLVNANRETGQNKIVGTARDVQIERRDGERPWVSLSLSKVLVDDQYHYTAFVRDITEQRQEQDQIRSVLEQAIDAVVQIDDKNEVIYFNPAAEELWGYPASEVLGRNVKMLVPAELRHQHDSLVNANRETGQDKIVGMSRDVR